MGKIGVLPTKTSIELRDPDGDAGTIPAATAAAAGVMSAHHVKMLEEVYAAIRSNGVVEIITPASARPSADPAQVAALRSGVGAVSQRLAELEAAFGSQRPAEFALPPTDQSERVALIEQITTSNSQQIATLAGALDEIVRLVEEAHQRIAFIEGNALASVSVETREGQLS